jgi:hypothetical protein
MVINFQLSTNCYTCLSTFNHLIHQYPSLLENQSHWGRQNCSFCHLSCSTVQYQVTSVSLFCFFPW